MLCYLVDSKVDKSSMRFLYMFVLNLKNMIAAIIILFCEQERKQTEKAVLLFALGKQEPLQSLEMRLALS